MDELVEMVILLSLWSLFCVSTIKVTWLEQAVISTLCVCVKEHMIQFEWFI